MKYNDNGEWKDIQVKVANAIQNEYGESNNDGYSQNYLNDKLVNVGVNDTDYRVNFLKGKNLFDKNGFSQFTGYVSKTNNKLVFGGAIDKTLYIPIKPNTQYTASKIASNPFYICTSTTIADNTPVSNAENVGDAATTYTITSGANDKYLCITYFNQNSTQTQQAILDSIQIEEGNEATSYEPYVDRAITVDGETIYNQDLQNYSTSEKLIGTWIDGKPLYRKVIDFGALPNNTSKTVSTGLDASTTRITKIEGVARSNSTGACLPIPHINTVSISTGIQIEFNTSGQVMIRTASDYSSLNGYITLEYTKTSGGQE